MTSALSHARRRVRDRLAHLSAIRVGRLTGSSYRIAAAEVGLAAAIARYRAIQKAARAPLTNPIEKAA